MEKTIFYQAERAKAKALSSSEIQSYIEVLEQIAEAGFDLWINLGQVQEQRCADDLYDILAQVDFLHDN